jgi:hypothetical protein
LKHLVAVLAQRIEVINLPTAALQVLAQLAVVEIIHQVLAMYLAVKVTQVQEDLEAVTVIISQEVMVMEFLAKVIQVEQVQVVHHTETRVVAELEVQAVMAAETQQVQVVSV